MSQCSDHKEWFASWFDTSYYHLLYAHRSHDEASAFIGALLNRLQLPKGARVLDLACGKGRHSLELSKNNLDVTGVDLSPCSIQSASAFAGPNLRFEVQDMRQLNFDRPFAAIFNLFTSFGYFDCNRDNARVLAQVHHHLAPSGVFVLDYFNATRIHRTEIHHETIQRGEVIFNIKKWVEGDNVLKQIEVIDGDFKGTFQEKVQLLSPSSIATLLHESGFRIFARFGNYQLEDLDETTSPRCVVVAHKAD